VRRDGAELPPCDVLTFGSPCQDLSVAGKRAGLDGGRSSMFYEAVRIIKEMRDATTSRPTGPVPRCVVWENVPGALSSNGGADFQAVIDSLGDIGAVDIQWSVLDAQHFGVPQRRRRIFLVAVFDPATAERCGGEILPVREGSARDFASGRKKREEPARSATAGSAGGSKPIVGAWEDITPTLMTEAKRGDNEPHVAQPIPIQGTIIGRSDTAGPQGTGVGQPNGVMYTLDRVSMHGVAQPIIFENLYRDGPRIGKGVANTLSAKMGTGGNNVPMITEPFVKARRAQSADDFETWGGRRRGFDAQRFRQRW